MDPVPNVLSTPAERAAVERAKVDPGHIAPGTRFVIYEYVISIVILSFKQSSGVKEIPPGGSAVRPGLPYTLVSLVLGWWGIPWGPWWTIRAVSRNLRGGHDVTSLVINENVPEAPASAS